MKYLILIGLLLTACDNEPELPRCQYDQKKRSEIFDKCMQRSAEARKGVNYTTNDDEDFDEVIDSCSKAAGGMALIDPMCHLF